MDRRYFLIGAASSVATMTLARASLADSHAKHAGHAGAAPVAARDSRVTALQETTLACQQAAADCLRHCLAGLGAGDTALADCMQAVLRMQAVTQATHAVAASELEPSALGRDLVGVCADFCDACASACEPHAEMHAACKACMDACRRCIESCDAWAA